MSIKDLKTDPNRASFADATGIYCRAIRENGRWDSVDMAELDRDSLVQFVAARGPVTDWARDIVLILLGHHREGLASTEIPDIDAVRALESFIHQDGKSEHHATFLGILKSHEEQRAEASNAWDDIGSILQEPADDLTVPEYRKRVIARIQEKTAAREESPVRYQTTTHYSDGSVDAETLYADGSATAHRYEPGPDAEVNR